MDKIERAIKEILKCLPPGLESAREELKKPLRAGLSVALEKMNLVSREEYDIQTHLLERLRKQLAEVEQRVNEYERRKDTSSE